MKNLIPYFKNLPKETKLYSPMYGDLWLAEVDEENEIIVCYLRPIDDGCVRAILEQEPVVSFFGNGTTGLPNCNVSKECMLFMDSNKSDISEEVAAFKFLNSLQDKRRECTVQDILAAFKAGVAWKTEQDNQVKKVKTY